MVIGRDGCFKVRLFIQLQFAKLYILLNSHAYFYEESGHFMLICIAIKEILESWADSFPKFWDYKLFSSKYLKEIAKGVLWVTAECAPPAEGCPEGSRDRGPPEGPTCWKAGDSEHGVSPTKKVCTKKKLMNIIISSSCSKGWVSREEEGQFSNGWRMRFGMVIVHLLIFKYRRYL